MNLSRPAGESRAISRVQQAASLERRWQRFLHNLRIRCKALYVPLVLAALRRWQGKRLYLALDTSLLWNRYCLIHLWGLAIKRLWPAKGEACLDEGVHLWSEGLWQTNLVLANVQGTKEPWAVIIGETPSLQTLWQYGYRFRTEELFLDAKSGVSEVEQSQLRFAGALIRLYLVAARSPLWHNA